LSPEEFEYALKTRGPDAGFFKKNKEMNLGSTFGYMQYLKYNFIFILTDGDFLYLSFYLVCSLIGLIYNNIFYCFNLFDIIGYFIGLKNIVKSVTDNVKSLFLTFIFIILVSFIFTIILFFFLSDYAQNMAGVNEKQC
jgi:hypothetical protein